MRSERLEEDRGRGEGMTDPIGDIWKKYNHLDGVLSYCERGHSFERVMLSEMWIAIKKEYLKR